MAKGITFSRDEIGLLHEATAYALKRTFTEGEKVRLAGLHNRLEDRLLADSDSAVAPLALTEPESTVMTAAVDTYCEALDLPLAAEVSRKKARRLRELLDRMHERTGFIERIRRLFGRG